MKLKKSKPAATKDEFLVSVARSIGSTLGAVAAKVGRKRPKQSSMSRNRRRTYTGASKRSSPTATPKRGHRKRSGK